MKYFLTIMFSVALITAAFAQTDAERREAKRVILGSKKGSESYPKTDNDRDVIAEGEDRTVYGGTARRYPKRYQTTSSSSRESRISEINRTYDAKIYSIRQNRLLSRSQKERMIRQLEVKRRQEIEAVNNDYYGSSKRYGRDDDDYRNKKKHKKNNGNHYGWNKGKGNPHRQK